MTSRPFLIERVSAGDRFNLFSFMFLLIFVGLIGLWLWSVLPLLGDFSSHLGLSTFGKEKLTIIGVGTEMVIPTPTLEMSEMVKTAIAEKYPTPSPVPTYTPYPTQTPQAQPLENSYIVTGLYSWYWPPLGGINCDQHLDGSPKCETVANGDPWEKWAEIGFACPKNIPFGSRIKINDLGFIGRCVDRGTQIVVDKYGRYWFDHLTNNPLFYWSTEIKVTVYPN